MRIGTQELPIEPEAKSALDIELLLLHIPLFITVFVYAFDYLNWPLFFLLFYMVEMRIFIGNHDRFHTDMHKRLPRWLEAFSENLAVCVTPWDEPYDSIRNKHIKHHATHGPGKFAVLDTARDPHGVYELGGFWRSLLYCLFYEEVQLFMDWRNNNIGKPRLIRLLVYLPLQILFLLLFGWQKYLGVFLAMRLVGATAWFVFSWGIHQPQIYYFGFAKKIAKPLRWGFALVNGKRVTEDVLHHAVHHAWPGIPASRLHEVDTVVMRHKEAAPEMLPTTR